jgi:hypothetical protein
MKNYEEIRMEEGAIDMIVSENIDGVEKALGEEEDSSSSDDEDRIMKKFITKTKQRRNTKVRNRA